MTLTHGALLTRQPSRLLAAMGFLVISLSVVAAAATDAPSRPLPFEPARTALPAQVVPAAPAAPIPTAAPSTTAAPTVAPTMPPTTTPLPGAVPPAHDATPPLGGGNGPAMVDPADPYRATDGAPEGPTLPRKGSIRN